VSHPNRSFLYLFLSSGLLLLFLILALYERNGAHHPHLVVDIPGGLRITYLNDSAAGAADCERALDGIATVMKTACPVCRITTRACLTRLDAEQARWLSEAPLESYSARLPAGIALYASRDPELARLSCLESARQSAQQRNRIVCHPPHTPRPRPDHRLDGHAAGSALLALLGAAAAAWLICYLILRHEDLHAHYTHDHVDAGPQKFHAQPTPRVGGVALYVGLLAAAGVLTLPILDARLPEYGLLLIAGAPAFLGGLLEDVTKKVGVYQRLLLTMVSAALCAWLLGAVLPRLDLPLVDGLFVWPLLALLFTVFAVSGVANAINIIDGYNGLAAGYAVIVLAALAWVAAQVGDGLLFTTSLASIGALLGFLAWNWPKGRIFLGDGGAYLLGFLLAELSVLLVVRNPEVTPWFPFALMIYPVFETLFSIYRRKLLRNHGAMRPDALHLHQIIYARVVRHGVGSKDPRDRLARNSRVAPYLWAINAVGAVWACVFWQSPPLLIAGVLGFCTFYLMAYRRIVSWKVPGWVGGR
jgi:UDP-N-acetylmuramyl pentapeptide phosphotransferase/UDP-N-acetylglucosamine-1-phosphate transferase